MRVSKNGKITIPADICKRAGLHPDSEVDVRVDGNSVRVEKVFKLEKGRGARLIAQMRGRGDVMMSTDEILALTRGRKSRL